MNEITKPLAAILGSAFSDIASKKFTLETIVVNTVWGKQELWQVKKGTRVSYVIFRHGSPHRLLPHQINYRAQIQALKELGCGALLLTSSVGVLNASLPLYRPMLLFDLLMLENRLPDGSPCTMFLTPQKNQGHLIVETGLFSPALTRQIKDIGGSLIAEEEVLFAYYSGPRTKTAAENSMFALLGAHVNSMTLAPEVVLANELEIPCAALVVGHKYSLAKDCRKTECKNIETTLENSREAMEKIVFDFLEHGRAVPFENSLFRFGAKK